MDIVNTLRSEHDRVMKLIQEFSRDERPEARRQLIMQLVQELSVHEAAEEAAVWTEVRQVIDAKLFDKVMREQGELKDVLRQAAEKREMDVSGLLTRLQDKLKRHIATEQDEVFPLITQKCDQQTRDRLGTAFMDSKNALIDRAAKLNVTMLPDEVVEQLKQRR